MSNKIKLEIPFLQLKVEDNVVVITTHKDRIESIYKQMQNIVRERMEELYKDINQSVKKLDDDQIPDVKKMVYPEIKGTEKPIVISDMENKPKCPVCSSESHILTKLVNGYGYYEAQCNNCECEYQADVQ